MFQQVLVQFEQTARHLHLFHFFSTQICSQLHYSVTDWGNQDVIMVEINPSLEIFNHLIITSQQCNGRSTKCAGLVIKRTLQQNSGIHKKPDVQTHRVGSARTTNTSGKQRLNNTWYVSLKLK